MSEMATIEESSSNGILTYDGKVRYRKFDAVLEKVGEFGRYQIFTCAVIQFATIMWAGSNSFLSLAMLEPDIRCENFSSGHNASNGFIGPNDPDYCFVFQNCPPESLTTSNKDFFSPVEEWRLICDTAYIQDLIFGVYLCGRILGSFIGGHLGDYVGRKRGFFVAQFFILLSSVMSISSTSWIPLTVWQFLNGFMFGIIIVTSYALMFEYTSNKYSLIANASFQYCVGYVVVAAVGALTRDWRYYLIFVNLISAPLLVAYLLFLESPRYLMARGNLHKAAEVLTDFASERWNKKGVEVWPDELSLIPHDESSRLYTFVHLFSSKKLAAQSLLQMLSVFTYSIIGSIFLFDLTSTSGGPFLHFLLYGLIRVWVPILIIVLDLKVPKWGRRQLYLTSLGVVGICFVIIVAALAAGLNASSPVVYITSLLATIINISAYFMAVLHITAAVYPTVVRCTAFGTLHITDDIGTLLSQLQLERLGFNSWVGWPYIICLCFIIVTFIIALFLQQETKGKQLIDRLEDLKDD